MYDNARNMYGTYSGAQARFHQVNPLAEWVSCAGHSLHLVGTAAAESSTDGVRFFAIVQRLYTFLTASPQRWSKLLENLPKQSPVVKSLSETRWSARADAAKALASNYKLLQNSVDAIARNSTQPPLVVFEHPFFAWLRKVRSIREWSKISCTRTWLGRWKQASKEEKVVPTKHQKR